MKQHTSIFVIFCALFFTGCHKKDMGYITRTWTIDKCESGGVDVTDFYYSDYYANYELTFSENGSFTENYEGIPSSFMMECSGDWDFSHDANNLRKDLGFPSCVFEFAYDWKIDELSETKLVIEPAEISTMMPNVTITFVPL